MLHMYLKPWQWNLRARLLWATVFYRVGRYNLADITKNIIDSNRVREGEFTEAQVLDDRYAVLEFALERLNLKSGLALEFGVYKGQTLEYIAEKTPSNTSIVGFDSFQGLPDDWGELLPKGEFETPVPTFPDFPNISLEIGLIENTLPAFLGKHSKNFISFIHIDCDLYSTTKFILENILPRLAPHSIIVFDEYYGYPTFEEHEFKAWHEVCAENQLNVRAIAISSHSAAFEVIKGA